MKRTIIHALALLLVAVPAAAGAFEPAINLQGVTGVINTPSAEVPPQGTIDISYSNQIEPRWRDTTPYQDNYLATLGALTHVEAGVRLSEAPGQARDLSANLKLQLPFLPKDWPKLAVGAQDLSGGAPHFRTWYGVASHELFERLRLSLGYGFGPDHLEGPFGGVELSLLEGVDLLADYDAEEAAAALRLRTPAGWLPLQARAGLLAKTSLEEDAGDFDLAFTFSLPLGHDDRALTCPPEGELEPQIVTAAAIAPVGEGGARERAERLAALAPLQGRLAELGFENLRLGVRGLRTLVVEYENRRFNHNELDGLGLVLGSALALGPAELSDFVILVKNENLAVLEVSGPAEPFRAFFAAAPACLPPAELAALRRHLRVRPALPQALNAVAWYQGDDNATFGRSTLMFYPGLRNTVGTEVGVYDYLLSLKSDYFLHLWKGATLNLRADLPVANSDDYDAGEPFNSDGELTDATVERIMVNQAIPLAPGVVTLFGAGKYARGTGGLINETMWTSASGRHRLQFRAAAFDREVRESQESVLGSYRFFWEPLDLSVEATAGRFLNGDNGASLEFKRYFGDTSIAFYVTDTEERVGGFRISLPLTPRRDMKPGRLQVRGTERWTYGLETVLTSEGGRNPLAFGVGEVPQTSHNLARSYYNSDRLNEGYLREHLPRLWEAYRKWGM